MTTDGPEPAQRVRPLIRTRQTRDFTDEPVGRAELDAIVDAARWSGSGQNEQPWRFLAIRDGATLRRIAEAGLPLTYAFRTATAAVAIVMPDRPERTVVDAFDEGRAAERMLVAATVLGLGAGISWVRQDVLETFRSILALPTDRYVRTLVAIGHPSEAGRRPKSPPGRARLPREEVVFEERWPSG